MEFVSWAGLMCRTYRALHKSLLYTAHQNKMAASIPPTPLGIAKVKFGYMAQNADGLSIELGDRIQILQKDASGWWKGTSLTDGQTGWFPAAYADDEVCQCPLSISTHAF